MSTPNHAAAQKIVESQRGVFFESTLEVLTRPLARELHCWIGLAVASLAVAGLLAFVAVIVRTPGLREIFPWPWQDFFPKIVITHVDFSILLWFLSILGTLVLLATARISGGNPLWKIFGSIGCMTVAICSALLVVPVVFNLGEASLNNYVPVLTHPLFSFGLFGLFCGVAIVVIRLLRNLWGKILGPFEHGVAATGMTFLISLVCFFLAWTALPDSIEPALANERLFWGGGHVLQFVNTMLMLVSWWFLTEEATACPLPHSLFVAAMWSLAAVALSGVLFYGAFDVLSRAHMGAFTQLFQFGLPIPLLVIMIIIVKRLLSVRPSLQDISALSLSLSLLLFLFGGVLGYFLGGNDIRIPAHYHAVISGVTLAVMGLTFTLFLPLLQRPIPTSQAIRLSLLLYGGGQLLLSFGMFAAGLAGVPRKTAGLEQNLDTAVKYVEMVVYGAGGIIAIIGGVLFIYLTLKCLLSQRTL